MAKLNIFVSSTCYDLNQIRKDLNEAIIFLGHTPIMCENTDFSVNPHSTNTENCLKNVEEADVFVLIIGNRYGYQDVNTGKSITNYEFLKAVEKSLPIYTFTLKQMVYVFDVWKANPNADFSSIVDSSKIFNFIDDVRYKSGKWNFTFENAQDIIAILKDQLSSLFKESLAYQRKSSSCKYAHLQPLVKKETYDLLVNTPDSYEPLFMLKCMEEAVRSHNNLRNDYEHAIFATSDKTVTELDEFLAYANLTLGRMQITIESINNLFTKAFPKYYGEPGCPSDIDGLFYIANTYGKLYASLLEMAIECRSMIADGKYKPTLTALSNLPDDAIHQMEEFPNKAIKELEDYQVQTEEDNERKVIELCLTVTIGEEASESLESEMEELRKNIGIRNI